MQKITIANIIESLPNLTVLAIFFGFVIGTYSVLKEKYEITLAHLAEKEINEQNLLRLKTKAELEALRSQVNPHFLFNTLNSIASLISVDAEKAEDMVLKLSDLFRYTLDASTRDTVSLARELDTVGKYLEIEKIRLGGKLSFSIEMAPEVKDAVIPGLLLQPLVENSVKHGIAQKREGGSIALRCGKENGLLRIDISDTGPGFDKSRTTGGFGLAGVRERLELMYKDKYRFSIDSDSGTRISLLLPMREAGR